MLEMLRVWESVPLRGDERVQARGCPGLENSAEGASELGRAGDLRLCVSCPGFRPLDGHGILTVGP